MKTLYFTLSSDKAYAEEIVKKLNLSLEEALSLESLKDVDLGLLLDNEKLSLIGGGLTFYGDFREMLPRLKQANLEREFLVKASHIKKKPFAPKKSDPCDIDSAVPANAYPTLLDATAGMGEDSLILAASGFNVDLYERDPIIGMLLYDTLRRAKADPDLKDIANRMNLHMEDSIEAMKKLSRIPDVILLDPMFPERKKSGLIKKKFQLLQKLEAPCNNEEDLLNAALMVKPKKIVIKRPLKGSNLAGKTPSHSLKGKAIRYDIIVM